MFTGLESPVHLLLLLLIILLFFGAKRLPEMGRSLGRGIQEFKEGLNPKEEPEKAEGKQAEAIKEEEKEEIRQQDSQEKQGAAPTKG
jgi:sec-independent protein translocase protein TatA